MKKIIFLVLLVCTLGSCDYLDVVPDDTATLEDAFKNEQTAENFVFACYGYLPVENHIRNSLSWSTSNDIAGAYHWGAEWFRFLQFKEGMYSSNKVLDDRWGTFYQGIRQCYTFLNNIDRVKPIAISQADFDARKKSWLGEVNFLIAYFHYLLLRDYGPIVIVKEEISFEGTLSPMPRLPFDECVEEIAAMFDESMKYLSPTVQRSDYGRATSVVAQSMKAKMYLLAASPLFNGNTDYADFKNKDLTQLVSQTKDKEKGARAMKKKKKAIDMAHSAGFELYSNKDIPSTATNFERAVINSRYTMVDTWANNKELIWAYTGEKETPGSGGNTGSFQKHVGIKGLRNDADPIGAVSPTLTAVKIFHTENGLPPEKDDSFDWAGRMDIAPGDSTIKLHRNREPRFYAFIGYDRGDYEVNGGTITLKLKMSELNGCQQRGTDHLYSGYAIKKGVHPDIQITPSTFAIKSYPFPLLRLTDLYLAYVEACAEYSGQLNAEATTYFNRIRSKAGIPDLNTSYGSISGTELVEAVRRERMIEFVFEGQWYFDIRRWKIGEKWHEGEETGLWGLNEIGTTEEEFYQEVKMNNRKLIFGHKNYLLPIQFNYININPHLVQNPGW